DLCRLMAELNMKMPYAGNILAVSIAANLLAVTTTAAQSPPVGAKAATPKIVCSGPAAGGYAAFPDICRLPGGDLFCVFYSGYGHVSTPNAEWPRGGRIMAVKSSDNGQSWSRPAVIIDTEHDDRDPSITCLADGTLLVSWFTPRHELKG